MPLEHLVETFNRRFILENQLDAPPLHYDGQRVHGRFGALRFTSTLTPVRQHLAPAIISGHDTTPLVLIPATADDTTRLLYGEEPPNIVSLDRLSRTVHMLNYLPTSHDNGHLFVHVHPNHILTIKQDHGAYFEEIIQRCGLSVRRIVITLGLSKTYQRHTLVLLERFKNYRDRGYSTAITFDDLSSEDFIDLYKQYFLHRYVPDFFRFNAAFFHNTRVDKHEGWRRQALLSALRQVDTQIVLGGITNTADAQLAEDIRPDYVQGGWYDEGLNTPCPAPPPHGEPIPIRQRQYPHPGRA
jgi:EAL domain-containing protein (putative c-di-GMP-specific phosphodiesterase class I)